MYSLWSISLSGNGNSGKKQLTYKNLLLCAHELICSVMFSLPLSRSLYIYMQYMHVYNLSLIFCPHRGFSGNASVKNPSCQCRRSKRHHFNLWFRKMPWKRAWPSTPVFLPGRSHGSRSLQATVHRDTEVGHDWSGSTHAGILSSCTLDSMLYF